MTNDLSDLRSFLHERVPHLDQYFGVWAHEPVRLQGIADHVRNLDLRAHVELAQVRGGSPAAGGRGFEVTPDGVALIEIIGSLSKYDSSLSGGGGTIRLRQQIRHAASSDDVRGILLIIDSPGGTAAGTADLAAEVARANQQKPVTAYIEDLGASAAYWVASAAGKVFANAQALVGSIGTYAVLTDFSAQAAMIGVKVHVVRAGAMKGAGTPGTEITQEQLGEWQQIVNDLNEQFLAGVSAGRKLSPAQVAELADGRIHIAAKAHTLGLIDGIKTLDEALSQFSLSPKRSPLKMDESTAPVSTVQPPPLPAAVNITNLERACPGADNDFLIGQLRGNATLAQAQSAWMIEQSRRLETAKAETAAAKALAAKPGVPALSDRQPAEKTATGGDAIANWHQALAEQKKLGRSNAAAVAALVREQPELHAAYLAEFNAANARARQRV